MKRTLATAFLLCSLCTTVFAPVLAHLPTPQDDPDARNAFKQSVEFKPLSADCYHLIQTRLLPLQSNEIARIFGPKLDTAEVNESLRFPTNLVVPSFGDASFFVDGMRRTDLHAVGDVGYVQFFYQSSGWQIPKVYFRADDKFVPLKSTNDLRKRLEWDQAKLKAYEKWLDEHLPGK